MNQENQKLRAIRQVAYELVKRIDIYDNVDSSNKVIKDIARESVLTMLKKLLQLLNDYVTGVYK